MYTSKIINTRRISGAIKASKSGNKVETVEISSSVAVCHWKILLKNFSHVGRAFQLSPVAFNEYLELEP
ncbi:hypothetical protein F8M41_006294 [Gigaspora margarita]|uniref:Uncharacterized protein n=1 Tax=Gigaspora margarita TaxID=4874 RepID=A0A8H3X7J3_GIGMA|nr:hypothetical protein F8M41_006294 [Gigaspora margarita]